MSTGGDLFWRARVDKESAVHANVVQNRYYARGEAGDKIKQTSKVDAADTAAELMHG